MYAKQSSRILSHCIYQLVRKQRERNMEVFFRPVSTSIILLCCMIFSCCQRPKELNVASERQQPASSYRLNVYIENSGSMEGYMNAGSEFRDVLYDYISTLDGESDTTALHFINSEICGYRGDAFDYLTKSAFINTGKNRTYSDMADMMGMMMKRMNDATVSVFVSDCLLTVPYGASDKFMVNTQTKLKNIFHKYRNRHPDFAVCIYKFLSDFDGVYYGSKGSLRLHAKRPYYMWVMGPCKILAKIRTTYPNSAFKHGVEEYAAFTGTAKVPCTIAQGAGDGTSATLRVATGDFYQVQLKANLSETLQEEDYLTARGNYKTFNPSIQIENITKIAAKGDFTHLIDLSVNKHVNSASGFLTLNTLTPSWIEKSNDNYGDNVKGNLNKTFGIKYIIGGVSDAFKDTDAYAKITLTVK